MASCNVPKIYCCWCCSFPLDATALVTAVLAGSAFAAASSAAAILAAASFVATTLAVVAVAAYSFANFPLFV